MNQFDVRRRQMVDTQLAARGIADQRVLDAMARVPREDFVDSPDPYADSAQPIGSKQTISQPFVVARMTEMLEVEPGMSVLELGTGSGYQAAVLAEMGCHVYTIERHADLADTARQALVKAGYTDVKTHVGDGTLGWPEEGITFDRLLATAAAPGLPDTLLRRQLADGGRAVLPVGTRTSQALAIVTRSDDELHEERLDSVVFVPLIGAEGWED